MSCDNDATAKLWLNETMVYMVYSFREETLCLIDLTRWFKQGKILPIQTKFKMKQAHKQEIAQELFQANSRFNILELYCITYTT